MTEERKVDWGRPIEAIGADGSVEPAVAVEGDSFHDRMVMIEGMRLIVNDDGRVPATYWRIRNVEAPVDYPTYIPAQPTLPDDLTARMVAKMREALEDLARPYPAETFAGDQSDAIKLKIAQRLLHAHGVIAREALIEPADGDEVLAEELALAGEQDFVTPYGPERRRRLQAHILAAIKRGRALERGEGK